MNQPRHRKPTAIGVTQVILLTVAAQIHAKDMGLSQVQDSTDMLVGRMLRKRFASSTNLDETALAKLERDALSDGRPGSDCIDGVSCSSSRLEEVGALRTRNPVFMTAGLYAGEEKRSLNIIRGGQVVDTIDLGSQQILREPVPTKDDGLDLGILTVPIVIAVGFTAAEVCKKVWRRVTKWWRVKFQKGSVSRRPSQGKKGQAGKKASGQRSEFKFPKAKEPAQAVSKEPAKEPATEKGSQLSGKARYFKRKGKKKR
eukprot:gnl/TRDRNA2_/TRDRNA2_154677_c0_seq1.p1 gnl/TRDRNA2_/TRDRNA2_154677_c0~~gnl/TRDRNA2_/TRDRNA2_154677_c0_seq1.p1  ORF type:complete len:257 (-),score=28.92 gnl/TRDRNA2_/TRDRNA2_154677_c0_seq1:248-1018(-)